jgi:DNA-binding transcriptional ArsR family regulator
MSNEPHSRLDLLKSPASVFAALGDETRLAVLTKLCEGVPQSISRLTAGTNLSRQAVTKHLRVLANAGVVRKQGKKLDLTVRVTDVYKKAQGRWLVIHEHVSVPVDLETGKPDLASKP